MEERELLERYALALALVPDPDVAGDLFMDARDTADLQRRAAAWRRRNGLPEEPESTPAFPIDEILREQALHLARRARSRRRLNLGFRWGAVAGVLLAVALGSLRLAGGDLPLGGARTVASDPVFRGTPIEHSPQSGARALILYRMAATPGSVTVWWEVTGPDAAKLAEGLETALSLADTVRAPVLLEQASGPAGRNRLLGKSKFQAFPVSGAATTFSVTSVGEVTHSLIVPDSDPEASLYMVDQTVQVGLVPVPVRSVQVGKDYIQVRYKPERGTPPLLQAVGAGGEQRRPERYSGTEDGDMAVTFGGLPADAESLVLQFGGTFHLRGFSRIPIPGVLESYRRTGSTIQAYLPIGSLPTGGEVRITPDQGPLLVDISGERYKGSLRPNLNGQGYYLHVDDVPDDARLTHVLIDGVEIVYPQTVIEVPMNRYRGR